MRSTLTILLLIICIDLQAQLWPDEEHIGQFLLFKTEADQFYNTSAPNTKGISSRLIGISLIPGFWQSSSQANLYLESSQTLLGLQFTHSHLLEYYRHSYTLSFAKDLKNIRLGSILSAGFLNVPSEDFRELTDVYAALWGSWKAGEKTNMAIRVLANTSLGFENMPQELRIGLQHELSQRLDSYVDIIHRLDYGFFVKFAFDFKINEVWALALGTAIGEQNYLFILGRKFGKKTESRLSLGYHPYFGMTSQLNAYIQFGKK